MRTFSIIAVSLLTPLLASSYTTLVDQKGRSIEVSLVSHSETHVKCLKKGAEGKDLVIPFKSLSSESVAEVKKFPLLEVEVRMGKGKERDESEQETAFGASYITFVKPVITVRNTNPDADLSECDVQLYLLGSEHSGGESFYKLVHKQTFSLIPSVKKALLTEEKFEESAGAVCKGYVISIFDESGKLLFSETSLAPLKGKLIPSFFAKISGLTEGAKLEGGFVPVD